MIVAETHVIVWDGFEARADFKKAKKAISETNASDGIIFCEISLREIAMLIKKDRRHLDSGYPYFINLVKAANKYFQRHFTRNC
ncbi:type II toxin-antitoxin system VapC family toxin [candidate division KSB1 bacterium]|nr:type II toxin-antitoxin system VapC family toxin [candidate division KSB1 bacterium]NIR70329.1 type II toxin-antitoxin system VapC family toxin [candidate division KSB1 bacterium]NIS27633.1 type II toxin-antitoxin system VapC family toxin [candidate division KSB1 bacterium]NIT74473.1 type II toxin-antitoxin system VapC family toxin [candidate division KSB1 bacterium]NIU28998.1 type II toxin-antitoxin system VapC family toxin [candidate division KSB1 bacterium]